MLLAPATPTAATPPLNTKQKAKEKSLNQNSTHQPSSGTCKENRVRKKQTAEWGIVRGKQMTNGSTVETGEI